MCAGCRHAPVPPRVGTYPACLQDSRQRPALGLVPCPTSPMVVFCHVRPHSAVCVLSPCPALLCCPGHTLQASWRSGCHLSHTWWYTLALLRHAQCCRCVHLCFGRLGGRRCALSAGGFSVRGISHRLPLLVSASPAMLPPFCVLSQLPDCVSLHCCTPGTCRLLLMM